MRYVIVECPYCGTVQSVRSGQKTRTCPKCGRRFKVAERPILAYANSALEATHMVKYIKAMRAGIANKLYGGDRKFEV